MKRHLSVGIETSSQFMLAALVAVALAVAACSSQPPQIVLEDPRGELSPVFVGAASLYLTVRNTGGSDALVGASVGLPKTVTELHDVRDNRMVRIERIAVPARGAVQLRPGSRHVMVFNLPRAAQEAGEVVLTLRFERAGEKTITARIKK